MPTLRPFRDYDEKDVINLFTVTGAALPITKGTLVAVGLSGFNNQAEPFEFLGAFGGFNEPNTVAQRYGTVSKAYVAGTGDIPLGMTLFDMREVDENGLLLKYNPRKAAEMEAIISGQTMPIVTRGLFLYSGITGNPAVGANLYVGPNGTIDDYTDTGVFNVGQPITPRFARVGKTLGKKDGQGFILIKLEL
jgi:hypothetical protein